ncbi:hypothetical protein BCQ47_21535 [Salmonella enterica subsp. enterica serovar Schwarzengrund]|nr:hypothetical protein [Salmonella enterica subsp. enterica serovar Schwarzengrund]
MLAEMYINALGALKAQSEGRSNDVKRLAQGCEVEAGHIYRIMHAHNTNIVEMNEELLERFMAEEIASGSPYPSPDRDGLQFVDLEQDVEVYPCIMRGCVTSPIDNESYTLAAHEAIAMLALLRRMGKINLIADTIQSLVERKDGTRLQTAFPDLIDVKKCIQAGLDLPDGLLTKINQWESLGATEINFDFVELNG